MKVLVKRIYTCAAYTISHVYIDGLYVCDALEDTDRMLDQSMSESDILDIKIKGKTAIPTGKYKMLMNIQSPKFSKYTYYKKTCNGYLPRLNYVKGFTGILWHCGNTAKDTDGCLLLGYNKEKGKVLNSRQAFEKVYNMLKLAVDIGQTIWVEYTRTY